MSIIALVIIGAAAGFVATRLMRIQLDLLTTIAIGVFGALLGGLMLQALAMVAGWLGGFVGAVLGAMALIWLWRRYAGR
jgi:uncharacterized membrane protein YeaQ/YmgE (transglycosylase-associated protein family)